MQIQTTAAPNFYAAPRSKASAPTESVDAGPKDEFRFSLPHVDVKGGLLGAGLGVIPLVGAGTNFAFGVEAQFNDRKAEGHVAMAGLVSNLAGTAALAGGLIFGSQAVATAGVALLGVSGLTAAYAAAT